MRGKTYLLVKNELLLLQNLKVVLKSVKFSLLLQTALHGALAVLNQTTIKGLERDLRLPFVVNLAIGTGWSFFFVVLIVVTTKVCQLIVIRDRVVFNFSLLSGFRILRAALLGRGRLGHLFVGTFLIAAKAAVS